MSQHGIFFVNSQLVWIMLACATWLVTLVSGGATIAASTSLLKLERSAPLPQGLTTNNINLYAARGEMESFQILIRAESVDLTNCNLFSPSALVSNSSNPSISSNSIRLFRAYYHNISTNSPTWYPTMKPLPIGFYPDGLVPFTDIFTNAPLGAGNITAVPFRVPALSNQALWIDITIPNGTSTGWYNGDFKASCDQISSNITLKLFVWNFSLPKQPHLKSSFSFWIAKDELSQKELLRHRLNMESTPDALLDAQHERDFIDNYGMQSSSLGLWGGADYGLSWRCAFDTGVPTVNDVTTRIGWHAPDLWTFAFVADEIGDCQNKSVWDDLKKWSAAIHEGSSRVLVTMPPNPYLYSDGSASGKPAVDIWTLLPVDFLNNSTEVAYVKSQNGTLGLIWQYNALVQDDYSPKWEIDYPPIHPRIQAGFLGQALDIPGLLYWRVDMWAPTSRWDFVYEYGIEWYSKLGWPGDGLLLWPGEEIGTTYAVGGMRLKWLRDSVDDYDYVEILKSLGYGVWAKDIVRTVANDFQNWTKDPNALENARYLLGNKIHELVFSPQVSPSSPGSGPPAVVPSPSGLPPSIAPSVGLTPFASFSPAKGPTTIEPSTSGSLSSALHARYLHAFSAFIFPLCRCLQ